MPEFKTGLTGQNLPHSLLYLARPLPLFLTYCLPFFVFCRWGWISADRPLLKHLLPGVTNMAQSIRRRISGLLRGRKDEEASMKEEVARQAAALRSLRSQVEDYKNANRTRQRILHQTEERLRDREAELKRLRQCHGELEQKAQRLEEKNAALDNQAQDLVNQVQDLEKSVREYRTSFARSAEDKRLHDQDMARARAELAETQRLAQLPLPALALMSEKTLLEDQIKQLYHDLAQTRRDRLEQDRQIEQMTVKCDQLTRWLREANEMLETTKSDMARELSAMARQQRVEMESYEASLRAERDSQVLDTYLTPRIILMNALSCNNPAVSGVTEEEARAAAAPFLQSCSPATLATQHLDIRLTRTQAKRLQDRVADIAVRDIIVRRCGNCRLHKLGLREGIGQSEIPVDEFAGSPHKRDCCGKSVCSECSVASISQRLMVDWWLNLNNRSWLVCPAIGCQNPAGITDKAELTKLLQDLKDPEMDKHLDMWDHAEAFRTALRQLVPGIADDALRRAAALHNHLVSLGCLYSHFDPRFCKPSLGEGGCRVPFDAGDVRVVSIDDETGNNTLEIPLFTQFFKKSQGPKQCQVCAEDYFEFDTGASAEEWFQKCQGFHGKWMWNILSFPLKLGLTESGCQHPIDCCTTCLQAHLKSQVEQRGRGSSGQLLCAAVDCTRTLDYHEIQLYADPDTFTEYDRYLYLDTLSKLPNFRWCLRPNCENGQLYNDDDQPLEPHYLCNHCGFGMCFTHSMPWHKGLTCEQYDSRRDHGDPDFQQTQEWIRDNTKPCPGCQQNIQKGEHCFHMTCANCNFEFCWVCLADWRNIKSRTHGQRSSGHAEGCFFRTNALRATELHGINIEAALLQRMENQEDQAPNPNNYHG